MADHCQICDTRRPVGGTNHLILGDDWIEFCDRCGETEMLTNADTKETACIADVFEMGGNKLPNRPSKEVADQWRAEAAKSDTSLELVQD